MCAKVVTRAAQPIDTDQFLRPLYRHDALLSQFSVSHLPEFHDAHDDYDEYRMHQIS
jgi:hypothetical protein